MRIVIAYDESEPSHAAISDLRRAGLPDEAMAWVVTASEVPIVNPAVGFLSPPESCFGSIVSTETVRRAAQCEHDRANRVAADGAKRVSDLFPKWSVHVQDSPEGPAYWAIVETAQKRSADLVVLGSHSRSMLGRTFFGSVAQNVLAQSPCSVRIGRVQTADSVKSSASALRVLIAVDGSAGSIASVGEVAGRDWPAGTEVRLATVCDLRLTLALMDMGAIPFDVALTEAAGSPIEKVVRVVANSFQGRGLGVSTVVLEGDPKHMLAREAEQWAADCIFLGAKGHSRLERFFIGSVSASLAARAKCSVEVTRTHG